MSTSSAPSSDRRKLPGRDPALRVPGDVGLTRPGGGTYLADEHSQFPSRTANVPGALHRWRLRCEAPALVAAVERVDAVTLRSATREPSGPSCCSGSRMCRAPGPPGPGAAVWDGTPSHRHREDPRRGEPANTPVPWGTTAFWVLWAGKVSAAHPRTARSSPADRPPLRKQATRAAIAARGGDAVRHVVVAGGVPGRPHHSTRSSKNFSVLLPACEGDRLGAAPWTLQSLRTASGPGIRTQRTPAQTGKQGSPCFPLR